MTGRQVSGAQNHRRPLEPDVWQVAASDAALGQGSRAAFFQRGSTHASSGAARVLSEDPMLGPALHARVASTPLHTTEDDAIAGDCDYPNADEGDLASITSPSRWLGAPQAGTLPAIDDTTRRTVEANTPRPGRQGQAPAAALLSARQESESARLAYAMFSSMQPARPDPCFSDYSCHAAKHLDC